MKKLFLLVAIVLFGAVFSTTAWAQLLFQGQVAQEFGEDQVFARFYQESGSGRSCKRNYVEFFYAVQKNLVTADPRDDYRTSFLSAYVQVTDCGQGQTLVDGFYVLETPTDFFSKDPSGRKVSVQMRDARMTGASGEICTLKGTVDFFENGTYEWLLVNPFPYGGFWKFDQMFSPTTSMGTITLTCRGTSWHLLRNARALSHQEYDSYIQVIDFTQTE
ncbi:MAG: hypothetical protein A3C84_02820 [Candidatus Ryanbacteria bacterium RIFCSPHIGHO2_02_FULL_48_12]|uniref:Uncharacterized protein n=1 Tax=Candidatus Ryanbacteria bacterium RIFCSPHIGHO2_01_FULL_48_27 TaxID=1802115 RepID=A0A1G2G5M0_9BACT|nr:MAG: hypothetical protein A2756_01290 [Candidatus Ryanbacteria bacterium RIFCSPHIGHO2_01_FULL_48_27]OGZ49038.1 MAG: hypothetical protein A3C84_02820 [Candidatus Ryanbacteria bacterium RIFCSPHIGHO2_02_FULL_48_12]